VLSSRASDRKLAEVWHAHAVVRKRGVREVGASLVLCASACTSPVPTTPTASVNTSADATTKGEAAKPGVDEATEPTLNPGAPVTLTAVPQHTIGPASAWRFDPDGKLVAWKNEDECGLWRYDSGAFLGYFPHTADGPCERWPSGYSRFIESSAAAPSTSASAGAIASVQQNRVTVVAADKTKLLDVECESCRRYGAVAWSPDGTQIAVARAQPWGVDLWSVADQKLIDHVEIDAQGKEQDIGVLWGAKGLFAFVSHAYDPNEGKYGSEGFGMEDYTHVHGPALSSFRLSLPRPPGLSDTPVTQGRELRTVSDALTQIIVDPQLGAAWVQLRSEDPREFGHIAWHKIDLGASPGVGGFWSPSMPSSTSADRGYYFSARWVERPHEILEAIGIFPLDDDKADYELLGIGTHGGDQGAAWIRRAQAWTGTEKLELRDPEIGGVGLDWAELRGRVCQGDDDASCEALGRASTCELVDWTPDGKRTISWCPPTISLLERDGSKVVDLIDLPPDELRWRWVDGDTLALLGNDRNLLLVSVSEAKVRETIPDVRQIYPLAAGSELALFAYRTGVGFHLRSVDGKSRFERSRSVFAAAIDPTGARVAVTDQKTIEVYEIATGTQLASWRAGKLRKLAYRQDGAVLFGTQVRERGPTRAWDPQTGTTRDDAIPEDGFAQELAQDPSWRWAWSGSRLRRALDGRSLYVSRHGVMLDNGLYEGEPPSKLADVVLRRGDTIADFEIYDATVLAPALRREGLLVAFMAGEPLPDVVIGELELARLLAAASSKTDQKVELP
jgi:hypothetical protein